MSDRPENNKKRGLLSPLEPVVEPVSELTIAPIVCRHQGTVSEIETFFTQGGKYVVIAETFNAPGFEAATTADQIVLAVNSHDKLRGYISELQTAVNMLLECDGITWEAEQEGRAVLKKIKQNGVLQ